MSSLLKKKAGICRVRILSFHLRIFMQINFYRCLHNIANWTGFSFSSIESNQISNDLSKGGRINEARHMFYKMPKRDEFSWNTMIDAFANSGRLAEAKHLFYESPLKSSITWSSLTFRYCKYDCKIEAFDL